MNSKHPPQNLPNEDLKAPSPQAPADASRKDAPAFAPAEGPQSLPHEDVLDVDQAQGLNDPDEKLKRIEREGEINKVNPEPENNIGPDTTGVGQPSLQPVNQGQSLPQSAVPVEKKFEGTAEQFYDPNAAEVATHKKEVANSGAKKTPE
jgi:hypothetical protein